MKLFKFLFNPDWFTFYMGGGAPSQPTSQNVTQTSIPEYAKPYVENMLGKADAFTNTPYQAYGGQRIADFTDLQNQAFQGAANLGPTQQIDQGSQLAGMAGVGSMMAGQNYAQQATNPGSTQAYMSPYIQGALDPQLAEARRQSDITGTQNASQAVGAGAFGGSRFGIQEAERQRNLGQNLSNIYGTGMQNAFQNAQQAQQFGSTLGLQGMGQALQSANTLGQLGQTQFGQQQGAIQAQSAAGAQQQAQAQQGLTQQYQDFLTQRGYPQQQLAFMSDILRGIPLSQQTQQQYTVPQSIASQAAQLGLGAYGASKAFGAEGGQVKTFAEGGIASAGGYSVPPEKLMGMMQDMSTSQLEQVGRGTSNAMTLGIVQAEMNRRQTMHDGQILARSTPEGTVKDAMMGIDEAPISDQMFADTAVGETLPEETTPKKEEPTFANGGGIVAFAKGGKPDYIEQLANQDVSKPAMSEDELNAAQERGIARKKAYMGEDETKGLMEQLTKLYGEGYSPEAKEQQKGLMALKAAAAFAPSKAGEPAPTFMGGLGKAMSGVTEDLTAAKEAEAKAKQLMLSAKMDYAKSKRAEKAGDYEAGQHYADSMYAKQETAKKAEQEQAKALAEIDLKREGYANQIQAATISAGPGYASANKPTDFRSAQSSFLNKAMADFKAANPGRAPSEQEFAAMNQTATENAGNLMKQYSGDINRQKADQAAAEKARELALKQLDSTPGLMSEFRKIAKSTGVPVSQVQDQWIERKVRDNMAGMQQPQQTAQASQGRQAPAGNTISWDSIR